VPDGIDVLLVTFNSAATVAAALGAALASPRVTAAVVVDNASGDGSVEAAAQAGATVVLRNPVNVGFAAAVNRGLRECHGEYVLLLNPDATLEPSALELLAAALDETPAAVMAGPVLVAGDGRLDAGARRFSTWINRLAWHLPLPRRPQWTTPEYLSGVATGAGSAPSLVDYLWGAALLVRRRFLNDIGGLDERFFLYSEDEDLGRQARARGALSLLVPRARAAHVGSASTPDAALAQARVIAANALLLEKWEGRGAAFAYRWGIGAVLGVRAAALRVAARPAEADLAARTRKVLRASWAGR
jgi:N-acetylglucosaminyl-diphospho-decaprenol L-rhamnosyltransferase